MEYTLSFHTVILGDLVLCIAALAIGWILDLCRDCARRIHRDDGMYFNDERRDEDRRDPGRAGG